MLIEISVILLIIIFLLYIFYNNVFKKNKNNSNLCSAGCSFCSENCHDDNQKYYIKMFNKMTKEDIIFLLALNKCLNNNVIFYNELCEELGFNNKQFEKCIKFYKKNNYIIQSNKNNIYINKKGLNHIKMMLTLIN